MIYNNLYINLKPIKLKFLILTNQIDRILNI